MWLWLEKFVPRGSIVLAITTFLSYALGLVRDRTFARTFGAGVELDSYNAAFLVPDFLFNLLVASGIAAAVVPLFLQLRRRKAGEADQYINSVLTAAITTMFVVGVLVILFAPYLARLVAPGISEAGYELIIKLMRVLAISPILFAASNALGAMLVAKRRFLFYGLSPVLYNIGIISGTLLLAPRFGIMGVAAGTVAGAGLHLLVRVIDSLGTGWRPVLSWQAPAGYFRKTLSLMVPKMFGHPVELVTFWVFTSLASLLAPGSIAVLNFARNFQSVPVSLIGIAMATAVFPALSEIALTSRGELRALLRTTTFSILAVSSAAALVMFVVRRPLVAILLGGGAFDAGAVALTAATLGFFCLSIPTESLSHLLARAFYATQNTLIPVAFSVVSLGVAGFSAYFLSRSFGLVGLPLGFFLGSAVKTAGLWVVFLSRTKPSRQ